jgi:hypothetical protein
MDKMLGRVYHNSFVIPLYDFNYEVIISSKDIHFASMTANVVYELKLDIQSCPGYTCKFIDDNKQDRYLMCIDISYYDEEEDSPNKNISNISMYACKLAYEMLEDIKIKDSIMSHALVTQNIVTNILDFVDKIAKDNSLDDDLNDIDDLSEDDDSLEDL